MLLPREVLGGEQGGRGYVLRLVVLVAEPGCVAAGLRDGLVRVAAGEGGARRDVTGVRRGRRVAARRLRVGRVCAEGSGSGGCCGSGGRQRRGVAAQVQRLVLGAEAALMM